MPALALPGPAPFVAFKAGFPDEINYIEVALVADAAQMAACGGAEACAQLMDQIASQANRILQSAELSPRLRIVIVKQLMLSDTTFSPTGVGEVSADEALLYAFSDWAMGALDGDLDVAILITAEALSTSDLGITTLNGACRATHNYAVIRGGNLPVDKSAEILVHELGHLMGMRHDGIDNDCPADGALMRAVGTAESLKNPRFSACSQKEFAAFLANSYYSSCVRDLPNQAERDLCGDGFRSGDEACDCGNTLDCAGIDPCCEAKTCELAQGAVCSSFNDESSCCTKQCQMAEIDTACRPARDECDRGESCTGLSFLCPPDTWNSVGKACVDNAGFDGVCYQGRCNSGDEQCRLLADEGQHNYSAPPDECRKPERECTYIECLDVETDNCRSVVRPAADGTRCSLGLCQDGVCANAAEVDECPDSLKSRPGTCGCNAADDDIDGDGYLGCLDGCPNDTNKIEAGMCGCAQPEVEGCAKPTTPSAPLASGGAPSSSTPHQSAGNAGAESDDRADPSVENRPSEGGALGCGCVLTSSRFREPPLITMPLVLLLFLRRRKKRACSIHELNAFAHSVPSSRTNQLTFRSPSA